MVIASFPPAALEQYYVHNFISASVAASEFEKLTTLPFALSACIISYQLWTEKGLGADFFIRQVDQVQADVFVPLYLKIILPDSEKLVRPLDRKTAVISLTKTSHGFPSVRGEIQEGLGLHMRSSYSSSWKNPPMPTSTEDTIAEQDPDDMSFGVGFTQLTTIKRPPRDGWPDIHRCQELGQLFVERSRQKTCRKDFDIRQREAICGGETSFLRHTCNKGNDTRDAQDQAMGICGVSDRSSIPKSRSDIEQFGALTVQKVYNAED